MFPRTTSLNRALKDIRQHLLTGRPREVHGVTHADLTAANQELDESFGLQHHHSEVSQQHGSQPLPPVTPPLGEASTAGASLRLTHVDDKGQASMVDVSNKAATVRSAAASCRVMLGQAAFSLVVDNARQSAKGNVLGTAQLAGIMAAKQTSALIPLCHNIPLSKVGVKFELDPSRHAVHISAEAHTVSNTGVEMEALTAASVAALTVYDMCKAVSKDIEITALRLEAKSGGRSGNFRRTAGVDTVNE
ncbi:molybdenum cofactor biosynthesis protein C, partial [Haematococcus lacustris]